MKKALIVGQGIAGTVLAHTLLMQGIDAWVLDYPVPGETASRVAAGIINPVTGKRFVPSWMYDTLFPFARQFYLNLGTQLKVSIWTDFILERLLNSPEEMNNWSVRMEAANHPSTLDNASPQSAWKQWLTSDFFVGMVQGAARVHFEVLLPAYRAHLHARQRLIETQLTEQEIVSLYKKDFEWIVFCVGAKAAQGELFSHLPWNLTKGEALVLHHASETFPTHALLKKNMLLAPMQPGYFWLGSTNAWSYTDEFPTEAGKKTLWHGLEEMLQWKPSMVSHRAAIRPTVKDRRPFMGAHPTVHKVFIFNGLGTKAALLAPYWAQHFSHYLIHGVPLSKEVDIHRFEKE